MLTSEYIKAVIQKNMECNFIEIKGDDGSHFEATIVSDIFEGLTKVMQHQKVYDALDGMMKARITCFINKNIYIIPMGEI